MQADRLKVLLLQMQGQFPDGRYTQRTVSGGLLTISSEKQAEAAILIVKDAVDRLLGIEKAMREAEASEEQVRDQTANLENRKKIQGKRQELDRTRAKAESLLAARELEVEQVEVVTELLLEDPQDESGAVAALLPAPLD